MAKLEEIRLIPERVANKVHDAWVTFRDAVRRLPLCYVARSSVGSRSRSLELVTPRLPRPPRELVTMRAELVRLGGKHPVARFSSPYEDGVFSLEVPRQVARALGPEIYREVEIEARVQRNAALEIETGEVIGVRRVETGDVLSALRTWYQKTARGWDLVDDIEGELERGD